MRKLSPGEGGPFSRLDRPGVGRLTTYSMRSRGAGRAHALCAERSSWQGEVMEGRRAFPPIHHLSLVSNKGHEDAVVLKKSELLTRVVLTTPPMLVLLAATRTSPSSRGRRTQPPREIVVDAPAPKAGCSHSLSPPYFAPGRLRLPHPGERPLGTVTHRLTRLAPLVLQSLSASTHPYAVCTQRFLCHRLRCKQ